MSLVPGLRLGAYEVVSLIGAGGGAAPGRTYDVSPGGERFLMVKEGAGAGESTAPPPNIMIVQNWVEELKRLVPTP